MMFRELFEEIEQMNEEDSKYIRCPKCGSDGPHKKEKGWGTTYSCKNCKQTLDTLIKNFGVE